MIASLAMWPVRLRRRLWRVMKSPDLLQIMAWMPKGSMVCEQLGAADMDPESEQDCDAENAGSHDGVGTIEVG
jgi:hypothetical protein